MDKSRGLLLLFLLALGGLACVVQVGIHGCLSVMFGLAVVAGVSGETRSGHASLWAAAGIAAYLLPFAWRSTELAVPEGIFLYGLVPLAIALLAAHTHTLTQKMAQALATSEVARSKLLRSNKELALSMEALEAALAKLETIVDHMADGLVVLRKDGEVVLANRGLAELLGLASPEPGDVKQALPSSIVALAQECLAQDAATTRTFDLDGGRAVSGSASPVPLAGSLWGAAVLVRDITLQKELDRMKSDFAATVSHEMRTPLTSVLGFAQLIRNAYVKQVLPHVHSDAPRTQRASQKILSNLQIIEQEGQRLAALIDDVLDISKMEAGEMEFAVEPQAPAALLSRAIDASQPLFASAEVELRQELPQELPPVAADRDRIQQVLLNLIGNARKFTDAGAVVVSAVPEEGFVRFAVRDTGVGIPPTHQQVIFDKFKQVGDVLTDRPAGTGLGLPICREIVTRHGGQIGVHSALDVGSTFWFTLPIFREA